MGEQSRVNSIKGGGGKGADSLITCKLLCSSRLIWYRMRRRLRHGTLLRQPEERGNARPSEGGVPCMAKRSYFSGRPERVVSGRGIHTFTPTCSWYWIILVCVAMRGGAKLAEVPRQEISKVFPAYWDVTFSLFYSQRQERSRFILYRNLSCGLSQCFSRHLLPRFYSLIFISPRKSELWSSNVSIWKPELKNKNGKENYVLLNTVTGLHWFTRLIYWRLMAAQTLFILLIKFLLYSGTQFISNYWIEMLLYSELRGIIGKHSP